MSAQVDRLIDEALLLSPEERSALVVVLRDSLEGEDESSVAAAWMEEIRERKRELRAGAEPVLWRLARARLNLL